MRVLVVCMGNICRSPTAEAILRHQALEAGLADRFEIDSAGTGSWHAGQPPDIRARAAAALRGLHLDGHARAVTAYDFHYFDLIVAVDDDNLARLKELAPADGSAVIRKLDDADVPDPYYGADSGFSDMFDQLEVACRRLLAELTA